ncbi:lipoprotein insertase outer membrane protein LolB [Wenzhouxiangella sp. XN24]|uniref:lipoprotein insertase outer membrane protein LolB n=1 Tax=Wenzhouxiangella sp. XN24 TaxID=2713569 RepID=UPI0023F0A4D0|nr:lipoprotein insertase outer membrane protein LolB [Wenzhouxiangella sp. XN24]
MPCATVLRRLIAERASRFSIIVLIGVLGGGCAAPVERPVAPGIDWLERRETLRDIEEFRMEGRLALNTGRRGYSGTVSWEQNDDIVDFRFRGPFGFGGFRIHGDPEQLRVKTTAGDEFLLTDPEKEMNDRFGWSLPVHSMRYWILGVSDPGLPATEVPDEVGLLESVEQAGWAVYYDSYGEAEGLVLPRRLDMERGDVRIRVMTDRWEIPGASPRARR